MTNNATNGAALQWLSTPEAARQLGISQTTLRRMRDREDGLKQGLHYKRGLFQNTPVTWNVSEIARFIEANAYSARTEQRQG